MSNRRKAKPTSLQGYLDAQLAERTRVQISKLRELATGLRSMVDILEAPELPPSDRFLFASEFLQFTGDLADWNQLPEHERMLTEHIAGLKAKAVEADTLATQMQSVLDELESGAA